MATDPDRKRQYNNVGNNITAVNTTVDYMGNRLAGQITSGLTGRVPTRMACARKALKSTAIGKLNPIPKSAGDVYTMIAQEVLGSSGHLDFMGVRQNCVKTKQGKIRAGQKVTKDGKTGKIVKVMASRGKVRVKWDGSSKTVNEKIGKLKYCW